MIKVSELNINNGVDISPYLLLLKSSPSIELKNYFDLKTELLNWETELSEGSKKKIYSFSKILRYPKNIIFNNENSQLYFGNVKNVPYILNILDYDIDTAVFGIINHDIVQTESGDSIYSQEYSTVDLKLNFNILPILLLFYKKYESMDIQSQVLYDDTSRHMENLVEEYEDQPAISEKIRNITPPKKALNIVTQPIPIAPVLIGVNLEYKNKNDEQIGLEITRLVFSEMARRYEGALFRLYNSNSEEISKMLSFSKISEIYYRNKDSHIDLEISFANFTSTANVNILKDYNAGSEKKIIIYLAVPAYLSPSLFGSIDALYLYDPYSTRVKSFLFSSYIKDVSSDDDIVGVFTDGCEYLAGYYIDKIFKYSIFKVEIPTGTDSISQNTKHSLTFVKNIPDGKQYSQDRIKSKESIYAPIYKILSKDFIVDTSDYITISDCFKLPFISNKLYFPIDDENNRLFLLENYFSGEVNVESDYFINAFTKLFNEYFYDPDSNYINIFNSSHGYHIVHTEDDVSHLSITNDTDNNLDKLVIPKYIDGNSINTITFGLNLTKKILSLQDNADDHIFLDNINEIKFSFDDAARLSIFDSTGEGALNVHEKDDIIHEKDDIKYYSLSSTLIGIDVGSKTTVSLDLSDMVNILTICENPQWKYSGVYSNSKPTGISISGLELPDNFLMLGKDFLSSISNPSDGYYVTENRSGVKYKWIFGEFDTLTSNNTIDIEEIRPDILNIGFPNNAFRDIWDDRNDEKNKNNRIFIKFPINTGNTYFGNNIFPPNAIDDDMNILYLDGLLIYQKELLEILKYGNPLMDNTFILSGGATRNRWLTLYPKELHLYPKILSFIKNILNILNDLTIPIAYLTELENENILFKDLTQVRILGDIYGIDNEYRISENSVINADTTSSVTGFIALTIGDSNFPFKTLIIKSDSSLGLGSLLHLNKNYVYNNLTTISVDENISFEILLTGYNTGKMFNLYELAPKIGKDINIGTIKLLDKRSTSMALLNSNSTYHTIYDLSDKYSYQYYTHSDSGDFIITRSINGGTYEDLYTNLDASFITDFSGENSGSLNMPVIETFFFNKIFPISNIEDHAISTYRNVVPYLKKLNLKSVETTYSQLVGFLKILELTYSPELCRINSNDVLYVNALDYAVNMYHAVSGIKSCNGDILLEGETSGTANNIFNIFLKKLFFETKFSGNDASSRITWGHMFEILPIVQEINGVENRILGQFACTFSNRKEYSESGNFWNKICTQYLNSTLSGYVDGELIEYNSDKYLRIDADTKYSYGLNGSNWNVENRAIIRVFGREPGDDTYDTVILADILNLSNKNYAGISDRSHAYIKVNKTDVYNENGTALLGTNKLGQFSMKQYLIPKSLKTLRLYISKNSTIFNSTENLHKILYSNLRGLETIEILCSDTDAINNMFPNNTTDIVLGISSLNINSTHGHMVTPMMLTDLTNIAGYCITSTSGYGVTNETNPKRFLFKFQLNNGSISYTYLSSYFSIIVACDLDTWENRFVKSNLKCFSPYDNDDSVSSDTYAELFFKIENSTSYIEYYDLENGYQLKLCRPLSIIDVVLSNPDDITRDCDCVYRYAILRNSIFNIAVWDVELYSLDGETIITDDLMELMENNTIDPTNPDNSPYFKVKAS